MRCFVQKHCVLPKKCDVLSRNTMFCSKVALMISFGLGQFWTGGSWGPNLLEMQLFVMSPRGGRGLCASGPKRPQAERNHKRHPRAQAKRNHKRHPRAQAKRNHKRHPRAQAKRNHKCLPTGCEVTVSQGPEWIISACFPAYDIETYDLESIVGTGRYKCCV